MLKRLATALWGNFESSEELKKFGFLAVVFGFIIGTYWTLRPMKDGIFNAIIGIDYQPYAKILSVIVIFPLVILYSKLIDLFPRNKIFYVLIAFYASLAIVFAYFLQSAEFGLLNPVKSPARILGWLWYVYVESFGSLIVALFWAFTTDTTLPDSAKRGFPLIALFGQIGNMVGPYFLNAKYLGFTPTDRWLGFTNSAPIVGICSILMILTGLIFWVMFRVVPQKQFTSYEDPEEKKSDKKSDKKSGFLDGLRLLITEPYLLGIFMIITIYEVIMTLLDFHFKATAAGMFLDEAAYSSYLSNYAVMTGLVSMLCVLFGINNIQRKLGMKASLVLLPILVSGAVIMIKLNPAWLAMAFWIMVFSKAVNYALNQPTLKQLYIPTTKETKYKSQAWIEMFGSRGSKAAGSGINTLRAPLRVKYGTIGGINAFLTIGAVVSGSLVFVWLFAALYIASAYNKAIKENKVVC